MNPWQNLVANLPPEMLDGLLEEIRTGRMLEEVRAESTNKQIGAATHQEEVKALEGVGRLRMEIEPTSYHFWGQKLGYQCWKDGTFLREYERDNPACRVKSTGTRLQVGFGSAPSNRRFRKVYEPSLA
jgi:hypothetical protein